MTPYEVTRTRVDLTAAQVKAVLDKIRVGLEGWRWEVVDMDGGHIGIRIGVATTDRDTGRPRWQYGRTWWVEPVHDEADVIRTVFLGMRVLFDHELHELLEYDGTRVFQPHGRISDIPWPDL